MVIWVHGTSPRFLVETDDGRKFAQLNLARVKFHNPQLDIKVLRRPWAGKEEQLKYPCTATIYKRLASHS
jgi:hypothetical protein